MTIGTVMLATRIRRLQLFSRSVAVRCCVWSYRRRQFRSFCAIDRRYFTLVTRQRGMAIAIVSCGSYLAGTIWPPAIGYGLASVGWRQTNALIGVLSMVTMLPLIFLALRPRAPQSTLTRLVLYPIEHSKRSVFHPRVAGHINDCWRLLLRNNVHAAGPNRRLLWRSWIRTCTGR